MLSLFIFVLTTWSIPASAIYTSHGSPVVQLNYGSFQGIHSENIIKFLGMPFAAPPLGNLRWSLPQNPSHFNGIRQATAFSAACAQLLTSNTTSPEVSLSTGSEDCLYLNVVAPASIPFGKRLPVVFWINGGQYETGDTSSTPGDTLVQRSIALGQPVVYVSTNYRLNAWGFSGSAEIQAAGVGNLGLRDQRFALQWVQQHISEFGGDPTRVTLSGESAGAMSVGYQMITNNGNPGGLYHNAFMSSGSPTNLKDISFGEQYYDQIVNSTGCANATSTLSCLKTVPFANIQMAIQNVANVTWSPYVDGSFFNQNPLESIMEGRYAKVPIVSGDVDDEGTKFAIPEYRVTDDKQYNWFVFHNYLLGANTDQQNEILAAYPNVTTVGSPYNTGDLNAMTPEYKRLSSFQGDITFQMPRRNFLSYASKTQPVWSFLYVRGKSTPDLGSYHTLDVADIYGTQPVNDYILSDAYINFANTLSPTKPYNKKSYLSTCGVNWPLYNSNEEAPPLLTLWDTAPNVTITSDTFRQSEIALLLNVTLSLMTS